MRIEPENANVSLVMRGHFNPSIFTPQWFAWHGLLPEKVVDVADLKIAHPEIAMFGADWLNLIVQPDRLAISTTQSPFVRLHDLAVRIFREHLPHTPLAILGINREVHFAVQNFAECHKLCNLLAPVAPWGDWGEKLTPGEKRGGMTSLTMTQWNPEGRPPGGAINVTVKPLNLDGQGRFGISVSVNDHYTVEKTNSEMANREIVALLEENFDESLRRADQIIDHIMALTRR